MSQSPVLPAWATELRDRYLSGEASVFLLHGNVRDLVPWRVEGGEVEYVSLRSFLGRFLGQQKAVVYYNCSAGLDFADPAVRRVFARERRARERLAKAQAWVESQTASPSLDRVRRQLGYNTSSDAYLKGLEREVAETSAKLKDMALAPVGQAIFALEGRARTPATVLPVIEALVTDDSLKLSVVIDYVETIIPGGQLSFMNEADKANLVTFQRWSWDPAVRHTDNLVVLVTENLADLNRRVSGTPQIVPIRVPLPGVDARRGFIESDDLPSDLKAIDDEQIATHTAGLSLVQVRALLLAAQQSGDPIGFRTVSMRKKAIIEQECHGLVEFVDPRHDFSHVGGMERVKEDLHRLAQAIRGGHRNRVPMGLIFVGPMGTGKTYLAEAFAGESGLTCLKFKNFREKWVGSTEGNLEKILEVVDALGYVLLLIDEADRSLSSGGEGDGGTGSRVIARLKEFMSDTSHRGRVVIVMMTNRPDKLDTDLKRPGRFDVKVPFFFPESVEERSAILGAILRKNKVVLDDDVDLLEVADATQGYSAAELEAIILAAGGFASVEERDTLAQADLLRAADDVIQSRDVRMLEFMELLAVFEASSKRMLPDHYREMGTDEVLERLDAARARLGARVL